MKPIIWIAASTLALAACGQSETATSGNDIAPVDNAMAADDRAGNEMAAATDASASATAALATADGTALGTATATQAGADIQFRVTGMRMPAGNRGVHVHMVGTCEGPAFESAGAHWNPTQAQHGQDNPQGAHKGDLPNLEVASDGSASLTYVVTGAMLGGGEGSLLDADGAAFVVHQSADDYRTDPSGNSGDRIACGVFRQG